MKEKSVKETIRIAKKYGYKLEYIYCGLGRAYLSAFDNFLKSPYPRHFCSVARTAAYVKKALDNAE